MCKVDLNYATVCMRFMFLYFIFMEAVSFQLNIVISSAGAESKLNILDLWGKIQQNLYL